MLEPRQYNRILLIVGLFILSLGLMAANAQSSQAPILQSPGCSTQEALEEWEHEHQFMLETSLQYSDTQFVIKLDNFFPCNDSLIIFIDEVYNKLYFVKYDSPLKLIFHTKDKTKVLVRRRQYKSGSVWWSIPS